VEQSEQKMAFREITYKGAGLTVHKAITSPSFGQKTVLAHDTWDYVDLWLRRSGEKTARFYWQQARSFFDATRELPTIAAPLTAYYCFLNATKALLISKKVPFSDLHGVSGYTIPGRTALSNEKVMFKGQGILSALCTHLGEQLQGTTHSLHDLLYNLPYVHRAFDLTYESSTELFIPIANPSFVRSTKGHEAWFVAELVGKYATEKTTPKLPIGYERERSDSTKFLIRRKKRFTWDPGNKAASITRLINYHRVVRSNVVYINGSQRLWYLKRGGTLPGAVTASAISLAFAAMHKLSELSRYTPDRLAKHLECQHNWLLAEFIDSAPLQFIDAISSEMTGREFMTPGRSSHRQ
jgi:hypothetical protein